MNKIDWSKAPDDCIGAVENNNDDATYPFGVFVKEYDGFDGYQYCHEQEAYPCMEAFTFTPRPQTTLTYTQVMADSGELPSVGMECRFHSAGFNDGDDWCIYHGKILRGGYIIEYKVIGSDLTKVSSFDDDLTTFKPPTPPIELINGNPYQFSFASDDVMYGIYNSHRKIFSVEQGTYFDIERVYNIQPLTVRE